MWLKYPSFTTDEALEECYIYFPFYFDDGNVKFGIELSGYERVLNEPT